MTPTLDAPLSVNVPSADLINYRFDQSDKKFEEMGNKLDVLLTQNSHFLDDIHVKALIEDTVKPLRDQLSSYRWYFRACFSATILAVITAAIAYVSQH